MYYVKTTFSVCKKNTTETKRAPTTSTSRSHSLSLSYSSSFQDSKILDLELESKEVVIKVVNTDITILSSTGKGATVGVDGNGVDGSEMSTDTSNLLLEDLVPESALEFTLSAAGCCDIHGLLSSSDNNKLLVLGHDGCRVKGSVSGVCLENLQ